MQIFSIFKFMFFIAEKMCDEIIFFLIINCYNVSFFFEDKWYLQMFCGMWMWRMITEEGASINQMLIIANTRENHIWAKKLLYLWTFIHSFNRYSFEHICILGVNQPIRSPSPRRLGGGRGKTRRLRAWEMKATRRPTTSEEHLKLTLITQDNET